jgi:hypothetical protein
MSNKLKKQRNVYINNWQKKIAIRKNRHPKYADQEYIRRPNIAQKHR